MPQLLSPDAIRQCMCPACGNHVAVPFFDGGTQPLATIAWPKNLKEAQTMRYLPIDFVRCIDCGHIFNAGFDYAHVPYSEKPNLMFNRGALWSQFIRGIQEEIVAMLPENPTVVEIGHGDGSFLAALAGMKGKGRYIGFDPHGATEGEGDVSFRAELFVPGQHLQELKPDILIMRHVLEHLTNTLGFMQEIAYASVALGQQPWGYFEVPCVDRVIETGRTVDLYYEHSSQFTTTSFSRMVARSNAEIYALGHGYDGEVVYAFARFGRGTLHMPYVSESTRYAEGARTAKANVGKQLDALHQSGRGVAIWGGTGKSASFMNYYGVDAKRFPTVVDSDPNKVGTFVPGMGQEIRFRDYLKEHPVEIIIIPPQWRANDIVEEIKRENIACKEVLIEHDHRLIDFASQVHPYRKRQNS